MIQTLKVPFEGTYIKQGDTINRILFTADPLDPIVLTGATIKMQLYNGAQKVFDISVGSGITILTAKSFQIDKVEKEDNLFNAGTFLGDLESTKNGDRLTYFNVEYTVIKEYTK